MFNEDLLTSGRGPLLIQVNLPTSGKGMGSLDGEGS